MTNGLHKSSVSSQRSSDCYYFKSVLVCQPTKNETDRKDNGSGCNIIFRC